jgi:hypothetical protein
MDSGNLWSIAYEFVAHRGNSPHSRPKRNGDLQTIFFFSKSPSVAGNPFQNFR